MTSPVISSPDAHQERQSQIWHTLKSSDLFSLWPDEYLALLTPYARLAHYDKQERIVSLHAQERELMCVVSGTIEVSSVSQTGEKFIYSLAGPNTVVPVLLLLETTSPVEYSCYALLPVDVVHVPASAIKHVLQLQPLLWQSVAQVALKRQSDSLLLIQKHMLSSTRQLMASILLYWVSLCPTPSRDTGTYTLDVKQTDLASMTGTTRQTVNKELRQFADEGVLRLRYGRIVVLDIKLLRAAEL